jgi:exodeoxyribonuclease VII small subunit
LARLEAVLEALDHDNVRLEQALSLYEEEVQLVRSAERIIATARERVQAVQGQQRGE